MNTEYDTIIYLDADTCVLVNIDELFEDHHVVCGGQNWNYCTPDLHVCVVVNVASNHCYAASGFFFVGSSP